MTRLAPAARCAAALSFEVKMPVHSSAISTPRSFHGSVAGSLMAVTLIRPLPMLIASPLTVTSPGKRPCTESKRSRCALVSTGPRSLMPTTSISWRPASAMARSTLRPMRPNPLIPTRMDIVNAPLRGAPKAAARLIYSLARAPATASPDLTRWRISLSADRPPPPIKSGRLSPGYALGGAASRFLDLGQRRLRDALGCNSEMAEKVLGGRARPERRHADEGALGADDRVPAL